jgi:hypothetical protein
MQQTRPALRYGFDDMDEMGQREHEDEGHKQTTGKRASASGQNEQH